MRAAIPPPSTLVRRSALAAILALSFYVLIGHAARGPMSLRGGMHGLGICLVLTALAGLVQLVRPRTPRAPTPVASAPRRLGEPRRIPLARARPSPIVLQRLLR